MLASDTLQKLKDYGLHCPSTLTMAITGACNLQCSHCFVEAGKATSATHVPERIVRRLVEEFTGLGGEKVCFTGGEPLCHPAWLQLVQFGCGLGLKAVSIQTNGILLSDEAIAGLRDLKFPNLTIQISLDGATASTHDLVRGEGAFAGAIAGLQRLCQAGLGPQTTVFFTEMQHNLAEIPTLLELTAGMGIGAVVTGCLVTCGRAATQASIAPPTPEQYHALLARFAADPPLRELYEGFGTVAAVEWQRQVAERSDCCTFVENPYLTWDGRLFPCVLCHAEDYSVSGVFGKNLAAAFAEGAHLWSLLLKTSQCRTDSNDACRHCPGQLLCAGGCMGRAWGSHGDFLARDDRCEVRRSIYMEKKQP